MKHNHKKRIMPVVVAFTTSLLMTVMSTSSVIAEDTILEEIIDKENNELLSPDLAPNDVIEYLDYEQVLSEGHVKRMYDQEESLDTIIFANEDGSETAYVFGEAVKYVNESGEVADKSNKLYSIEDTNELFVNYAFSTLDNDIRSYFPYQLSKESGVLINYTDYEIKLSPCEGVSSEVEKEEDTVVYHDIFGDGTILRYTPQLSGYKEDIVLQEYSGNTFHFSLDAKGLNPVIKDGMVQLQDSTGLTIAEISPIFVYDSCETGNNVTLDNYFEVVPLSDETYELIIVVDDEFLQSPETVYPVIIDPSVTMNATGSGSSKKIMDTPIYNGAAVANNSSGANSTGIIGYVNSNYGSGRLLMKFPGLNSNSFSFWNNNYTITRAFLTVKEVSGLSNSAEIKAYTYNGADWNESSVYSTSLWNGADSELSSATFSYPNSVINSFDITDIMQHWKSNPTALAKGIILQNSMNEQNTSFRKILQTSEGATKPYLSVTYLLAPTQTIEDGIYYIQNVYSGKYLDIDTNNSSNGTANQTSVIQRAYHGGKSQQFKVTRESDGYYSLRPRNISDESKAIDLHTPSLANINGTQAQIYTYSANYSEQKFIISPATSGNGGYRIGSKMSNGTKVLRVVGSSTADNANIEIYSNSNSSTDDNWYFEKAFGGAPPFSRIHDTDINCASYALQSFDFVKYGDISSFCANQQGYHTVEEYASATIAYFNNYCSQHNINRTIVRIPGVNIEPTYHLLPNEYRVALRCNTSACDNDYHFVMQLNNGNWAHKPGQADTEELEEDFNPNNSWNFNHNYNSDVIYFAVYEY